MTDADRVRVAYVVDDFPQLSQTYLRAELRSVARDHDVRVVGMKPADRPYADAMPYVTETDEDRIVAHVEAFRPHVLHTHYLHCAGIVERVARRTGVPFTVRTHSFDVLPLLLEPRRAARRRRAGIAATRSPFCLATLAFPFLRDALVSAGVSEATLVDAWPVVDYAAFHDLTPRAGGGEEGPRDVMNVGACIAKKRMEDFVDLAARVPDRRFRLYAIGYRSDELDAYVRRTGSPVDVVDPVEPRDMPAAYRRHGWLVYTGCFERKTVGWPMAVAEAQAAGIGVVVARVRPDLETFVGPAGFLYDDVAEVPEILARGYPAAMREAGYAQAERSDIEAHRGLLTSRWRAAAEGPRRSPDPPRRRLGLLGRVLRRAR